MTPLLPRNWLIDLRGDRTVRPLLEFGRELGHRRSRKSQNTIERTVRDLKDRFHVKSVWYDPYQMAASAQRLKAEGLPMEEFPQTLGNLSAMGSNLYAVPRT